MKKKIIFFHLLNDFSGSPKVLSMVISGLIENYEIHLHTSRGPGFLSNIAGVNCHYTVYSRKGPRILIGLRFILTQVQFFFRALIEQAKGNSLLYINTMLPLGAMLGAWTGGGKFIVHRHEYEIRKSLFYRVSENFMNKHASLIICVSGFLYSMTKTDTSRKVRLYNALPAKEIEEARASKPVLGDVPAITMVSSLRRYKGVDVFAGIAEEMNWCRFTLILSATDNEIRHYFYKRNIPSNLVLINNVNDLHPFYSQANIVVNLSQSDSCIETFGMTILEAMSFGIPVIVPRTGGITELVDNGQNGFCADTSDPKAIADCIKRIISDKRAYQQMSLNALEKSYKFNPDEFKMQIRSIVEKVTRN